MLIQIRRTDGPRAEIHWEGPGHAVRLAGDTAGDDAMLARHFEAPMVVVELVGLERLDDGVEKLLHPTESAVAFNEAVGRLPRLGWLVS